MRRGETLGLRWEDVSLGAGTLTVSHTLELVDGEFRLKPPKTCKGRRTIHLPEAVVVVLARHRELQQEYRSQLG
jgi:integrase